MATCYVWYLMVPSEDPVQSTLSPMAMRLSIESEWIG